MIRDRRPHLSRITHRASRTIERLIEIPQNIFNFFDTDAQPHKVGCDSGARLLIRIELAVRRACRMNRQTLCIADVREVAEEFEPIDKVAPRIQATFDAKAENRARTFRQIFFRERVIGVALETWVCNPTDSRMLFQEFRDVLRVAHVAVHSQTQCFQSLQEQPGVHRRLARADIAQDLHAGFQDKRGRAETCIRQAMITRVWLGEIAEATAPCPIEIAAINDHAADARAVPADELGRRMDNDVRAPLERPAEVRRRKRIVDHRIVNLIAAFLKAGVLENGLFATTKEGTPQGGVVSPLLANIYLHAFDVWWWEKYGSLDANAKRRRRNHQQGNAILVRYADDFIMLWNGTHEGAKQLRDEIKAFLWDTLQLELAEEKTHITHVMDGFDFLGFHVQLYPQKGKRPLLLVKPSDANIQRFKTKIKNLLREQTALMPTDVKFQQLNRVIRGWGNYYRHVNLTTTAKKVDWWLNERVLIWLKDKHKGVGVRRILQQYKVREKKGQNERYNFASQDDKGKIVHIALLADIRITKYYWKRQPNPYLSTENILQQPEMETPFAEVKDMQFDGDNARLQKQRRRALKRDHYRCQICHRTWDETSIHVHHLIPRHEGGQDTLDNLMTLCEDCHISTPTFGRKPQANREESSSESRMR